MSTRCVIVWTPSYACKPFKVVYDSSKCDAKLNIAGENQIVEFYNKKGEDPDVKMFRVGPDYTNKEILKFLSYTMEIMTSPMQRAMNRILHSERKKRPLK
jgi:hypothetical protein